MSGKFDTCESQLRNRLLIERFIQSLSIGAYRPMHSLTGCFARLSVLLLESTQGPEISFFRIRLLWKSPLTKQNPIVINPSLAEVQVFSRPRRVGHAYGLFDADLAG